MKRILLLGLLALPLAAQVVVVPNTNFPNSRGIINSNFSWLNTNKASSIHTHANYVSLTGSYANPVWISSLAWGKIIGVPTFESTLSFAAPLVRSVNAIGIAGCADGEIRKWRNATGWTCEADAIGAPGGGIASLNGLSGSSQTFAASNDANVLLAVNSSGTAHTFTISWMGALAKARQHANTLYSDGSYPDPNWLTLSISKITGLQAALDAKQGTGSFEPPIPVGLLNQYWRGNKTWATLDKAAVGLGNVENTPISSWTGSVNVTTIGTLLAGTVPWARLSNVPATFAPSLHAAAHAAGQPDAITPAAIGAMPAGSAVPYSGATGPVDLGANSIKATYFESPIGTAFEWAGAKEARPTVILPTAYIDSAADMFQYVDTPSVLKGTMVAPAAARTANQFLTHIDTSGVQRAAALTLADLPAAMKVSACEIVIGDPGAASAVLADDNDRPVQCANETGSTMTITAVECYAKTGSPTVTPVLTGGALNSILSGALTCGTGAFASGTLNGTPTQVSGATIDGNITVAGGTAKYIVIRITRTL